MSEGARPSPNRFETKAMPTIDGAMIDGDDEIEPHGIEPRRASALQQLFTHATRDTMAGGTWLRHVAAICQVRPAARLISAKIIRAEKSAFLLSDKVS
jgi:hypothetical protein